MPSLFLKGPLLGENVILVEGFLRIGSDPTNDLCLNDPSVHAFHCILHKSGETVSVKSHNSTQDIVVDGVAVASAMLSPGQSLSLGEVQLWLGQSNTDQVEIRIPEIPVKPDSPFLPDGRPACRRHPFEEATVQCTVCGRMYCSECVHPIGLQGGVKRLFCAHCSQPCVQINAPTQTTAKPPLLRRMVRGFQHFLRRR